MVDRTVLVSFEAQDSGEEELTWGQADLWMAMQRLRTWMPIGAVRALPPGTTVDDVVADLRFLVSRHQAMRTRVRQEPGGRARQVVAATGEVPLEIVDTPPGADPAGTAEEVAQRFRDTPYDFATDWPVRVAVVLDRGTPTHRVMIMCHLVTDAAGAAAMMADLSHRYGDGPPPPVSGTPPLEQARWQRSPAGQRRSETALRHWEDQLRHIPVRRFRVPAEPCRPRYRQLRFHSRALQLAARAFADRTGADTATVLLAVFAVSLARTGGTSLAAVRVIVNNRFRPGLADAVAPISFAGLLVVDVADITVDEALARTRRRALATYKHAYYDPYRMLELVERVGRERGAGLEQGLCFFNDRRGPRREGDTGGPTPTAEQIRAALPHTTLRCEVEQDEPQELLFVHVDSAPEALDLTVLTDTAYLAPADLESCIRGMEDLAVAAAHDPAVPTGVTEGGRSRET